MIDVAQQGLITAFESISRIEIGLNAEGVWSYDDDGDSLFFVAVDWTELEESGEYDDLAQTLLRLSIEHGIEEPEEEPSDEEKNRIWSAIAKEYYKFDSDAKVGFMGGVIAVVNERGLTGMFPDWPNLTNEQQFAQAASSLRTLVTEGIDPQ